jgi:hypothetical protein
MYNVVNKLFIFFLSLGGEQCFMLHLYLVFLLLLGCNLLLRVPAGLPRYIQTSFLRVLGLQFVLQDSLHQKALSVYPVGWKV